VGNYERLGISGAGRPAEEHVGNERRVTSFDFLAGYTVTRLKRKRRPTIRTRDAINEEILRLLTGRN
jgi:hypothetical protein